MAVIKKRNNTLTVAAPAGRLAELISSENYFFSISPAANSITNTDGVIIRTNNAFIDTWGYSSLRDVLGIHCKDLFENSNEADAFFDTLVKSGTWEGEFRAKKKNGSFFLAHGLASSLIDGSGKVIGYQTSMLDVTERTRAEQRVVTLSQLGQRLNSAVTPQEAAKIIADAADILFGWDAYTLDLYSSEDDIITSILNIDTIKGERTEISPVLVGKRPSARMRRVIVQGSELILRKEGSKFEGDSIPFGDVTRPSLSLMFAPIRRGAKVVGVLSVQSYITDMYRQSDLDLFQSLADHCSGALERIQAAQEVEKSEERYRILYENNPIMVFTIDADGTVLSVNKSGAEQLGYTVDELVGKSVLNVFHEDDKEKALQQVKSLLLEPTKVFNWELRKRRKNGEIVWVSEVAALLSNVNGKITILIDCEDITKRKEVEQALSDSEEKLRTLINTMTEGLALNEIIYDENGEMIDYRILEVNQAFYSITDYKPGQIIGNVATNLYGMSPEYIRSFWKSHYKENKVMHTEIFSPRNNKWYFVSTSPFVNKRFVTSFFDITDKKRAEEQLRMQSIALNAAANAIVITDSNGTIEWVNKAFSELTGYTSDEAIGKNPKILKSDKQDQSFYKRLWETVLAGKVWQGEIINRRKDGSLYVDEQTITPIHDDHGAITHFIAVKQNITERKQTEHALIESEEKYRGLFDQNLAGIFVSTPDGTLIDCNNAFLQIFRFESLEEAKQTKLSTLYPDPYLRQVLLDTLQKEKRIQNFEHTLRRKDGSKADIIENVIGKFDDEGSLVELQGFVFDDTKRRELERELIQSQKMESLGTIAGGVAHDFNNILGIIMAHASMMEQFKDDSDRQSQSLNAIIKATQRGASLVKQLLTVARKTETNMQLIRVNEVVGEVVRLIQETFSKLITIVTSFQQELPFILADATQLHQIFLNLCVNARDAMPNGGVLTLSTSIIAKDFLASRFRITSASQYICVEVRDSGFGMDENIQRRIFEPFFTTKGPGKGTGLGLSLVFSIVENHRGFVDVQSAVGVGTAFKIYLPIPEHKADATGGEKRTDVEIRGGTETILVIEDEEMLRSLLELFLTNKGYTVLTADDGSRGVEVYKAHAYSISLVLSDLGLPGISGDAVFRKIREINPHVKMILASGYIDPEKKSHLYESGVRHFIQKPYSDRDVLQKIRIVLDSHQ